MLGDRITGGVFKFRDYLHSVGVTYFQARLPVWDLMANNLTELEWIDMVDTADQPVFPVQTDNFFTTFPIVRLN